MGCRCVRQYDQPDHGVDDVGAHGVAHVHAQVHADEAP